MNKRHNVAWRELLLLLVPAFALAIWGVWLQSRGPVEPLKPFKLVVDEIKITPLAKGVISPPEPNSRGIKVTVFIGHEGPAPAWWGVGVNSLSSRIHFTNKGEKDDGYTNIGGYTGTSFDKLRSQYTFVYSGEIPKNPNFLKQATCHISVSFETQRQPLKKLAAAKASISGRQPE